MKTRLTMCTALGRARRWLHNVLSRTGHEAGRGNVVTAFGLLLLYAVGL